MVLLSLFLRAFRLGCRKRCHLLIVRLGLEGLITFKKDTHTFDPEDYSITIPQAGGKGVKVSVFDAITVEVSIEKDPNTQRGKVKMVMVKPISSEGL
jgi:exosome complex exonuclease DIS3/RRP44